MRETDILPWTRCEESMASAERGGGECVPSRMADGSAPGTHTRRRSADAAVAAREQRAQMVEECADGRQRKVARADDANSRRSHDRRTGALAPGWQRSNGIISECKLRDRTMRHEHEALQCIMVPGDALQCKDELEKLACAFELDELGPWQRRTRPGTSYECVYLLEPQLAAAQTCTHAGPVGLLAGIEEMLRNDPAWAAQRCPACDMPQEQHTTYQAYLNRYAGSQSCLGAHVDDEPEGTTSLLVVLPQGVWRGGGAFRVQRRDGQLAWRLRRGVREPRDWPHDSVDVGLTRPFDACWVDGRSRYHGVSKVSSGTRCVFAIGRRCPVVAQLDA